MGSVAADFDFTSTIVISPPSSGHTSDDVFVQRRVTSPAIAPRPHIFFPNSSNISTNNNATGGSESTTNNVTHPHIHSRLSFILSVS